MNLFFSHPPSEGPFLYAIGDVHGQITQLDELLTQLPLIPEDRLVFLGDYIDRGEDSRAVVERLLEIKAERPNTVFLRGNHEELLMNALSEANGDGIDANVHGELEVPEKILLWFQNGGYDTLRSYAPDGLTPEVIAEWQTLIPETHLEFFGETKREFVTDTYHFVHAGIALPGQIWDGMEYGLDDRLWIREPFLSSSEEYEGRIVVFGHTPQRTGRPLVLKNKIGLDTAAVFGGNLTAAALDPKAVGRRRLKPKFYQARFVERANG